MSKARGKLFKPPPRRFLNGCRLRSARSRSWFQFLGTRNAWFVGQAVQPFFGRILCLLGRPIALVFPFPRVLPWVGRAATPLGNGQVVVWNNNRMQFLRRCSGFFVAQIVSLGSLILFENYCLRRNGAKHRYSLHRLLRQSHFISRDRRLLGPNLHQGQQPLDRLGHFL
jgi:hypothetical protein